MDRERCSPRCSGACSLLCPAPRPPAVADVDRGSRRRRLVRDLGRHGGAPAREGRLNIKVVPGGGTQNPVLVQKGEAELGMGLPPLLQRAHATARSRTRARRCADLRALAGNMSLNTFHFYVAADSPYAAMTMDDIFRGKKPIRLAISKPGSSDVWVFEKVMEFYGLCAAGKSRSATRRGRRRAPSSSAAPTPSRRARSRTATWTARSRSSRCPAPRSPRPSVGRKLKLLAFPEPLLAHLGEVRARQGRHPRGHVSQGRERRTSRSSRRRWARRSPCRARCPTISPTRMTKALNDNPDRVRKIHGSLADYEPVQGRTSTSACRSIPAPSATTARRATLK